MRKSMRHRLFASCNCCTEPQPFSATGISRRDLLAGELAVGHRVHADDSDGDFAIGNRLHLEGVHVAEVGNLLEAQSGVLDEPDGGRLRHQGMGHGMFLK